MNIGGVEMKMDSVIITLSFINLIWPIIGYLMIEAINDGMKFSHKSTHNNFTFFVKTVFELIY